MKKPEFVLTDRLPADAVAPKLLGRVVADIFHPTHYYLPEDPRDALKTERIEISDSNFSGVFSLIKSQTVKVKLGDILGMTLSSDNDSDQHIQTKWIKTETLTQHPDALANLLAVHRKAIQELLVANNNTGYMIVGIKTCFEPQMEINRESRQEIAGNADLPTAAAIQAASHGALQVPESMNISAEASYVRQGTARVSFQGVGEQVFAIQYRVIKLKPASKIPWSARKEARIEGKDLKAVDFDDRVFSSKDEDNQGKQKIVFGKKSKTASEERPIELSEDGEEIAAEAKRRGLDILYLPARKMRMRRHLKLRLKLLKLVLHRRSPKILISTNERGKHSRPNTVRCWRREIWNELMSLPEDIIKIIENLKHNSVATTETGLVQHRRFCDGS